MRQVAPRRVASFAFSRAVEIGFACFGISGKYVQNLVGSRVRRHFHLQMEKFRNVAQLLIGKRSESRHTLRGPTVADGRLDKFPWLSSNATAERKRSGPVPPRASAP